MVTISVNGNFNSRFCHINEQGEKDLSTNNNKKTEQKITKSQKSPPK